MGVLRTSNAHSAAHELSPADRDWKSRCDRLCIPLVITEHNLFRRGWSIVLAVLLIYTGTVFPFWLCFMEFKIPDPVPPDEVWTVFSWVVDVLFWVDLLVNFFFSYRDRMNVEVKSMRRIIWNYLTGFFLLNLIACLPESAVTLLVNLFTGSNGEDGGAPGINQATRMARLQRISRLTRLGRLTRLAKMAQFISSSPVMRWLRGLRGMRITNFIVGLLWVVHLIACGWYLCASLHSDSEETWVGRRSVNTDGTIPLLEKGSVEQWCHAVYFVLTVFTTVGFGDMSAVTTGEIVYVCFTMILGAVINSIIVSEVINIVTSVDREQVYRTKQKELVAAFSNHTELDMDTRIDLEKWIDTQSIYMDYDEEGVKRLLTSGALPRNLMATLPGKLFDGKLLRNNFVKVCKQQVRQLPPRFPVLMALKVYQRSFHGNEYVYHYSDQPYHVFLVMKGTFAHVAIAGEHGGVNTTHLPHGCFEDTPHSLFNYSTWSNMELVKGIAAKVGVKVRSSRRQDSTIADDGHKALFPHTNQPHAPNLTPPVSPATPGVRTTMNGHQFLCPYMLHSSGSFFGDVELMENKPRRSSVRCEKNDSALLVLHKQDLIVLIDEFPHFGRAWKASARRHERRQAIALESCTEMDHFRSYRELAATQIARMFRDWKAQGGLSHVAKRSFMDDASNGSAASFSELDDIAHARSTPTKGTMLTPLSAFVANMSLTATAQSAAPCGVNDNGEALTALPFIAPVQETTRSSPSGPLKAESKEVVMTADVQRSIEMMGDQIRKEMMSSIGELKNSVDELRKWVAPASFYGSNKAGRRSSLSDSRSSVRGASSSSLRPRRSSNRASESLASEIAFEADVPAYTRQISMRSVDYETERRPPDKQEPSISL